MPIGSIAGTIPNNWAVLAIKNIWEVYKERLKKHDFLQVNSAPGRSGNHEDRTDCRRRPGGRHRVLRGHHPAPAQADKGAMGGDGPVSIFRSMTRFLFVTTQAFAIIWVSWSYAIATYSTVVLFQPFRVETMSCQAIITTFGTGVLKVVENIFEQNEGIVFGRTASTIKAQTIPDSGGAPATTDDGEAAG